MLGKVDIKSFLSSIPTLKENLTPGNLDFQSKNSISWLKKAKFYPKFKQGYLILTEDDWKKIDKINPEITHIISQSPPRLEYAKILQKYFSHLGLKLFNDVDRHRSRKDLEIGDNVYIGLDVEIGENVKIFNNTSIHNNTTIGNNCIIKENVVIGSEGLGIEWYNGEMIKFPQIGGVVIGNGVEINTFTDIKRGALSNTVIGDDCKLGSYINVGHNVIIGKKCIFTSQCVIAGSTVIGDRFFMGVNSSTRNGVIIGNDCTLGAQSYLNRSTPDNQTIIGTASNNKLI